MNKKNVCCFDLEGPISVLDFAAEIGKMLSEKSELNLKNYDMGEFFTMISTYDDYLIDVPGIKEDLGIPEYNPGDTLRLMAPLYVACYTDEELINLAKDNLGLLPGCKELMQLLHQKWDLYVISTSYTQFAHNTTAALDIPKDHVYCTDLHIKVLKESVQNIEASVDVLVREIFQKYVDKNKELDAVINDLNHFFWKEKRSDYIKVMNMVKVRGGKRKELAVEDISQRTGVPISKMIAVGDSITDINMLERLKEEGGIAVSFNGNRFTAERSTVAVTTPNNLGALPIFNARDDLESFLDKWEREYPEFQENPKLINNHLIPDKIRQLFIDFNFVPEIVYLVNKTQKEILEIIARQEKMRKIVRGWAGNLG
ncbi:MAG: HAD hydrolase family protein [Promethearchaeota archaeon]